MLYEIKLKATSPWLGDIRRGKDKIRRFQRGHTADILAFDLPRLQWSFKEACEALHLNHVNTKVIRMEEGFVAPKLVSYRRRYNHQKKKEQQEDFFEAIREGTHLTMQVLVTQAPPDTHDHLIPPDQNELEQIFRFIGKMLGLSPWGGHFGYGRFEVLELKAV